MHEGFQDPAVHPIGQNAPETAEKQNSREPLDATKRDTILTIVRLGGSRRMAAREVGCAASTITRIAARDPQFAAKLDEAESKSDRKALQLIDRAADQEKYWRAAAWVLERRNPDEFGRRAPHTYTAEEVMRLISRIIGAILPAVPESRRAEVMLEFNDTLGDLEAAANAANPAAAAQNKAATSSASSVSVADAEAVRYMNWQRIDAWLQSLEFDDLRTVVGIATTRVEKRGDDPSRDLWLNRIFVEGFRRENLRPGLTEWEEIEPQSAAETDDDWSESEAMQHPATMGGQDMLSKKLSQLLSR